MREIQGTTELPSNVGKLYEEILGLFNKNPKTYYTQSDLVKGFGKSNPRTNKVLRDLVEDGKVVRTKVSNKYFYQKK